MYPIATSTIALWYRQPDPSGKWCFGPARLAALCLALVSMSFGGIGHASPALFGYQETRQADISLFRQWLDALERHVRLDVAETGADCADTRFNACHLREWEAFIETIRAEPLAIQLQRINDHANRKRYVLDIDNYGMLDYWAVAHEFLYNGGDCEDYAITKLFSLRWLGLETERLRIVVLQDTNLRIPHAVLAVYADDDIYILDNQIRQVVRHRDIVHYVPVYSINETNWWIHTPFL